MTAMQPTGGRATTSCRCSSRTGPASSPGWRRCSPAAGYNIFSLAVAPTEDERFSRITIVVDVESAPLEQITKQLFKLIDVVKISELDPRRSVERELLLATVEADAETARPGGRAGRRSSRARSSPSGTDALTVSLDGHPDKLDDFEELLRGYGIVELQRTGRVALPKLDREARLRAAERKGQLMAANRVLRGRRRPVDHPGPQGGGHRLRLAGPRPRAEPEGLGRRRARRPARGLVVGGQGRGRRACGCCRSPRPPPRPT